MGRVGEEDMRVFENVYVGECGGMRLVSRWVVGDWGKVGCNRSEGGRCGGKVGGGGGGCGGFWEVGSLVWG